MLRGAREGEEGGGELFLGDDPKVRGEAVGEADGGLRGAPHLPGRGARDASKRLGEAAGLPRRRDEIDVVDDRILPAKAPRDLDRRSETRRAERLEYLLGSPAGSPVAVKPGARAHERDSVQNLLRAARPEPLDAREPSLPDSGLQGFERVDAEGVLKLLDLARAEPRDPQAFTQARRKTGAQLVMEGERPRPDEGLDVGEEAGPDPRGFQELPARDRGFEVSGKAKKGSRPVLVGAHLERVLARELQHRRDLLEYPCDLLRVHEGDSSVGPSRS